MSRLIRLLTITLSIRQPLLATRSRRPSTPAIPAQSIRDLRVRHILVQALLTHIIQVLRLLASRDTISLTTTKAETGTVYTASSRTTIEAVRERAHSPQSYQNIAYGGPYHHDEPSVEDQVRFSAELTADEEEPVQVYDSVSQAGLAFHPQYRDGDMPPPPLPPLHMMPPHPSSPRYSHHGSHHGSGSGGPASWADHYPRGEQQFPPRRRSVGQASNEYSLGPTPGVVDGRRSGREQLPARRSSRSDKRERKGTKKTGIKVAGGGEVVRRFNGQLALVRKPKKRS
ncbi:hypothetical protein LQW54_009981 [Pestalotiopsis sp. IQ-011]